MNDTIEKQVAGLFTLIFLVIIAAAIVSVNNIRRSIASSDWVNHTHAVIIEADAILSSLCAGDSAMRAYLLTGDQRDQAAYRAAYSKMLEHLDVGKALTRAEPENRQFLDLEKLIAKRIDFTRSVAQARQQGGAAAASKSLAADSGSGQIDEISYLVAKLGDKENALLKERDKESFLHAQTVRWTIFVGVGINFVLLAFVGWAVIDDIAARRRAASALSDANAQLEVKVQQRTAELVKANQALKEENLERRWAFQTQTHQLHYSDLIFNSIGELVFVISKALTISRINQSITQQLGHSASELIGSPITRILQFTPAEQAGAAPSQNPIALALKEGRELGEQPATLVDKALRAWPVFFNLVPICDQNKVVGGVVTVSPYRNELHKSREVQATETANSPRKA